MSSRLRTEVKIKQAKGIGRVGDTVVHLHRVIKRGLPEEVTFA